MSLFNIKECNAEEEEMLFFDLKVAYYTLSHELVFSKLGGA